MSPDGMGLLYKSHAVGFAPAQMSCVIVVKHHVVFQKDHRMARVDTRERLAEDHITGYGLARGNLVETVGRHVIQVEVLAS